MPDALIVILIILGSILLLLLIAIYIMFTMNYIYPKRLTYENAKNWMDSHNMYEDFDKLNKIEYKITLKNGYELNARFIPSEIKTNKYVIILHGITANQEFDAKYVNAFRKAQYNVITYDSRGHGKNKRCKVTMGIRESKDLLEVIDDTYKRYGDDIFLGIQGESMGGGTVAYSLRYNPNIKFAIMDCPFETVKSTTSFNLKNRFHIPGFLGYVGNAVSTILNFVNLYSVDVKKDINNYDGPIAIFDGTNDEIVPVEASKNIYDSYNSYKEIHWYKDSLHAFSLIDHKEEYTNDLINFLNKIENKSTYREVDLFTLYK